MFGENMFDSGCVARCRECGEALYGGDMVYDLGGSFYCTACVDDALVVCHDAGEDYSYGDDQEEYPDKRN